MTDQYKNTIELLDSGITQCTKTIRYCAIFLFYGLGYSVIYSIWAWADSGKSVVDWFGIVAGATVVLFEIFMVRKTRKRRRAMIQAAMSLKRAGVALSYTAKEHYVDQAVAALNIACPGITAKIVEETIKEADNPDG